MTLRIGCLLILLSPLCLGKTLLILGDQLSSGAGLPTNTAWPALLKQRIKHTYPGIKSVNVSVSGMSTQGGLQLLPAYLIHTDPTWIILFLGYQNMLNATPLAHTQKQLTQLIRQAKVYGHVLLVGTQLPQAHPQAIHNLGINTLYQTLAKTEGVAYLPKLLATLTEDDFQSDQSTPNQKAQAKLLAKLWPKIKTLLAKTPSSRILSPNNFGEET